MTAPIATNFSDVDIQRFYEYLSLQLDPVLISETPQAKSYEVRLLTIHDALRIVRNDQTIQQDLPAGIESILTPLHIDVLDALIGNNGGNIQARTAFKILSHLTIDAGTAEFAQHIPAYAETISQQARIDGKPNREVLYRYLEEIRKDYQPDDDNQVFVNFNRIYNVNNHNFTISAFILKNMQEQASGVEIADIEHYLQDGFDEDVLPAIAKDCKHRWEQDAYRPDTYEDIIHLADEETKLLRHLNKRIPDKARAEAIFNNITAQINGWMVYFEDKNKLMDLALQNTDAGLYDNATFVDKLELPTTHAHATEAVSNFSPKTQTTNSNSPSLFLILPIGIAILAFVVAAKSMYRQANRLTFFASSFLSANKDSAELSVLIDHKKDRSDNNIAGLTTPTKRLGK